MEVSTPSKRRCSTDRSQGSSPSTSRCTVLEPVGDLVLADEPVGALLGDAQVAALGQVDDRGREAGGVDVAEVQQAAADRRRVVGDLAPVVADVVGPAGLAAPQEPDDDEGREGQHHHERRGHRGLVAAVEPLARRRPGPGWPRRRRAAPGRGSRGRSGTGPGAMVKFSIGSTTWASTNVLAGRWSTCRSTRSAVTVTSPFERAVGPRPHAGAVAGHLDRDRDAVDGHRRVGADELPVELGHVAAGPHRVEHPVAEGVGVAAGRVRDRPLPGRAEVAVLLERERLLALGGLQIDDGARGEAAG